MDDTIKSKCERILNKLENNESLDKDESRVWRNFGGMYLFWLDHQPVNNPQD